MATNETALHKEIRKDIGKRWPDSYVIKVHGSIYQESGIPDLLACIEGVFFGLEVKHQKAGESMKHAIERTTDVQRMQIERINEAGGHACTVLSSEQAIDFIERSLKKEQESDRRG